MASLMNYYIMYYYLLDTQHIVIYTKSEKLRMSCRRLLACQRSIDLPSIDAQVVIDEKSIVLTTS